VGVVRKGYCVIKRISLLVTAALMAAMMMVATAAPAFAVSPSQRECELSGGTFDRTNGQVSCEKEEIGKNDRFQCEQTTTGQGNINNKTQKGEETTDDTGSGKCPPGQFPD
jgi:hypothetical protein